MKWNWNHHRIALLLIAAVVATTVLAIPTLPDIVPTHFSLSGEADAFMSREGYAVLIVGGMAAVAVLLTFLPFLDPFWKRIQPKYGLLLLIRDICLAFFLFMHLLTIDAAATGALNTRIFGAGLGLLFVILGNYLPRIPRNWFFGIRVPWTLASDEVWRRTHRLGGWLFVLGGGVSILLSLLGLSTVLALAVPLTPVFLIVTILYPYSLYRKLERNKEHE